MLAYVFWHWPDAAVDEATYCENLVSYHQALADYPSPGFARSVVFSIQNASWLKTEGQAYEDWYLLQDSAALDKLNLAAVSGPREEPHNRVARHAAGGTAGLYSLRTGNGNLSDSRYALWFAKAKGVSYPDLYSILDAWTSQDGVALWSRQMTLGPTQEFCIHSAKELVLTPDIVVETVALNAIWSGLKKT
jgi:hypothetical protein